MNAHESFIFIADNKDKCMFLKLSTAHFTIYTWYNLFPN